LEKRSTVTALLIFGGLLSACFIFALILFKSLQTSPEAGHGWSSGGGPKIGVVELKGVISDSKETLAQLVAFRRDPAIKAIVVRVDSPGGAVGPSQEMFRAIQRARKDKKVVVSMGTVAASGGFYVSMAADKVYASPGTVTGSIGVISEFPDLTGMADLVHFRATTIKSGPFKDVGNPLRPMTADEKQYLQGFVDEIYDQFLSDVAEARKLPKEEVRRVADGRILSGRRAHELKLVDELGNLEDAVDGAMALAGLQGEPSVVFAERKRGLVAELLKDGAEGAVQGVKEEMRPGGSIELRDERLK
jgi:protease-4